LNQEEFMRYTHSAFAVAVVSVILLVTAAPSRSADNSQVTIPAGTAIPVRMIDSIDASQNQQGQAFRGSLDAPIHAGNRTVLPKGTRVYVKLVEVQSAGKFKGRNELRLELDRIVTAKATYPVHSNVIDLRGSSQGKKTGKSAGIGAAVGAGLGAIVGGGKGAAIGAGAGAGTGLAVQGFRKHKTLQVSSESLLTFHLQTPLHVAG
jgi:hypothetical protein